MGGSDGGAQGSAVGSTVLRQVNRSTLERLLRERGPLSRSELARLTGLAKPTVGAIVVEMLAEGIVTETPSSTSTIGRRPLLVEFQSERELLVGVQLGVNRTGVMAADSNGNPIASHQAPPVGKGGGLAVVAEAVRDCLRNARIPRRRLVSVGVCLPGMVDVDSGVCVLAPNLGWRNLPIAAPLEAELGVPVLLTNVTHAAAVAEAEEGAARGASDVVLLYAGTGIGAGILSGGRIYRGAGGMSGEIGHCALPGRDDPCACGKRGCLEAVAGAGALVRRFREGKRGISPRSGEGALELSRAAEAGDVRAAELLAEAGQALGIAASWLVNLFNPEVLVLAGGLVNAGPRLVEPLRQSLSARALPGHLERLSVVESMLGRDAYVRGAVLLARGQTMAHYRTVFAG